MPRLLFLCTFLMISSLLFAQTPTTKTSLEAPLDKALESSNIAIKDKSVNKKADTWFQHAALYLGLATTNDPEYKKLCLKPYKEISDCYKKAKELNKYYYE